MRTKMGHASVPEADSLLHIAANRLCDGDFADCRKFASVAHEYNPDSLLSRQLLAVAHVMLTAQNTSPTDWYAVLQVTRPESATRALIRSQYDKLAALVDPTENGLAFSDEAFRLVQRAWSELSDDRGKNTHFENGSKQRLPEEDGVDGNVGVGSAGETFWTVCPYCYGMFEYNKMYQDCCLRCDVCRKAFHGVPIKAPAPEIMVEGKEEYYFTFGCFQMEYGGPSKGEVNEKKNKGVNVVEISDDGDDNGGKDAEEEAVKSGSGGFPVKRMKRLAGRQRRRCMMTKTVARSTKKIMGNGRNRRVELMRDVENMGVDSENGSEEGGDGGGNEFDDEDGVLMICGVGDGQI